MHWTKYSKEGVWVFLSNFYLPLIFILKNPFYMLWNIWHIYTFLCVIVRQNSVLLSNCEMANVEFCPIVLYLYSCASFTNFLSFPKRIASHSAKMERSFLRSSCHQARAGFWDLQGVPISNMPMLSAEGCDCSLPEIASHTTSFSCRHDLG